MSPTVAILLAVVAIGWFAAAAAYRTKDPSVRKLGTIGGGLAAAMLAAALAAILAEWPITAVLVIPLLVATIVQFGFLIALVSRLLSGKIGQRGFLAGVLTIIAMILVGVVLMFQPFTPSIFNLGFDFVLIALLAFNIWSHVSPRPNAATQNE